MKYKVGEEVRIKTWEKMEREYKAYRDEMERLYIDTPRYQFTESVACYCGTTLKIDAASECGYHMEGCEDFIWTDEMIECVADQYRLPYDATYGDLEPGMIVTYKSGYKYFVTVINGKKHYMTEGEYIIAFPEKEIKLSTGVKSIKQIDDVPFGKTIFNAKSHVIWENTKEMTIKEAEEKLEELLKVPVRITN